MPRHPMLEQWEPDPYNQRGRRASKQRGPGRAFWMVMLALFGPILLGLCGIAAIAIIVFVTHYHGCC